MRTKRYLVTISLYMYANTDNELVNSAEQLAQQLRDKDDNRADVESIHQVPFASIGQPRLITTKI